MRVMRTPRGGGNSISEEEEYEDGRSHRGGGALRHFHGDRDAQKRQQKEDRHRRKGEVGGEQALPQGQDAEVHELQALLPHHDGVFGRGRLFGRQAVFKLRSGGRSAPAHRRNARAGDHRLCR